MNKLFLVVLLLVVAAWIGAALGHWADRKVKAIEVNRPYLEELAR